MTDRREDLDGRDRIDALEARYRRVARLLRISILALALSVVAALVGFGIVLSRVHDSRVRAATISCERFNDTNRSIRKFVDAVAPTLARKVADGFVIEPDCHDYAVHAVR